MSNNNLCELPSYEAARLFFEEDQVSPIIWTFAQRSFLISCGFLLTGHGLATSAKSGLLGSLCVEMYVLYKTKQILTKCK